MVLLAKAETQRGLQDPRVLALTRPIEKPPEPEEAAKLPQAGKGGGEEESEHGDGAKKAHDHHRLRRRRRTGDGGVLQQAISAGVAA